MAHGKIEDYRRQDDSWTNAAKKAGVYTERAALHVHVEQAKEEPTNSVDGGSEQEKDQLMPKS